MKTCSVCREAKPLEDYYLEKGKPRSKCKTCHKRTVYALRDADPEVARAKLKAWRDAHPGAHAGYQAKYMERNRDTVNARRRTQRAEDPERFRKQKRDWTAENAERINFLRREQWLFKRAAVNAQRRASRDDTVREKEREWRLKNPDLKQAQNSRRRARLAGVERQEYTRAEIWDRDGGECQNCDKQLPYASRAFHIDHIVPISLGGPDIPANLQLLCPTCNLRKASRLDGQIYLPV